jgi:TatD DNase family protein
MDKDFLIDTHCHLDFDIFEEDLDSIIKRATDRDIIKLITVSTQISKFKKIQDIIEKYDHIYGTIGTHPMNAHIETKYTENDLIQLAKHKKIVAIGECGLDYYRGGDTKEIQKKVFRTHLDASSATKLPVIIHNRSSDLDMEKILVDQMKKKSFNGVLHCFSSSKRLAEVGIELGLYLSFSGIVTFNNANDIRDIVKIVPNNRILVETDAPYLSPVPNRGNRNEPGNVWYTANELANIRNTDFKEVSKITTENALRLFDI